MFTFIVLMFTGLIGLVFMALPGFLHHGGQLSHAIHTSHVSAGAHHGVHLHAPAVAKIAGKMGNSNWLRLVPSPRAIFSLLAAYGAFGVLFMAGLHLSSTLAAWSAVLPAIAFERFILRPYWNWLTSFGAAPASPLTALVLTEAVAVSNFQNGRGIVQVEHDGRAVQMMAYLIPEQCRMPVHVGDRLRVESVDEKKELLIVSLSQ
ncbi:hypothetical protein CTKA_00443 [Chthonomonas calidirosea]|uniref:Uncharacterized protein n=1 Tax=Chthonomonas calidirosea (strain DSM 23976 / ICMP 18418 / T49) TaxID=1303518 RepID=S0EVW5_CHTCT|nr:hypothetical protein [Chthonomonas calidirosea]CCW34537.1 hypothetical protein CCALI_00712 [Chthonomonas calidirosea T49]CEK14499.1 hypothetical protein CTKA_00443 [Chthonomonas calidirosea]